MKALIWHTNGQTELINKEEPKITYPHEAIIKVTMSSICTSDIHIIKGYVPRAVPETVLGHEFVGEITELGSAVTNLKIGDRVAVNCETFCGECFFCRRGYVNNCINGGWELGCKIDGGHAQYCKIPYASTGLTKIPDELSYEKALFTGDILSSGYWSAELCEIQPDYTVAVIGAGPVGLCAMQSAKLLGAKQIIAIDINEFRLNTAIKNNLADVVINPEKNDIEQYIKSLTEGRGADAVIEAAGGTDTFQTAWKIARSNAIVAVPAMYESPQILPLPDMYGKNLTFKTGGVDANKCKKLLDLILANKLNTDFLITHKFSFKNIRDAYSMFEQKSDNCLKIAISY